MIIELTFGETELRQLLSSLTREHIMEVRTSEAIVLIKPNQEDRISYNKLLDYLHSRKGAITGNETDFY